eukprot:1185716-Prorocentrum_minimum.AAC.2
MVTMDRVFKEAAKEDSTPPTPLRVPWLWYLFPANGPLYCPVTVLSAADHCYDLVLFERQVVGSRVSQCVRARAVPDRRPQHTGRGGGCQFRPTPLQGAQTHTDNRSYRRSSHGIEPNALCQRQNSRATLVKLLGTAPSQVDVAALQAGARARVQQSIRSTTVPNLHRTGEGTQLNAQSRFFHSPNTQTQKLDMPECTPKVSGPL